MPFVKEKFSVPKTIKAFLYVMQTFGMTQGQAQRHIAKGRILINGESIYDASTTLEAGEIEMVYFKPLSRGLAPILKTQDFMLFDKPSGIMVHPNRMLAPYSMLDEVRTYGGKDANGTHRIDKETSGLFLASLNAKSESGLKMLFQERVIQKSYLAWVDGKFESPLVVEEPIATLPEHENPNTKHKVHIAPHGKSAKTTFRPLEYNEAFDVSLVECFPHTGRTHQIRIHLFHVKHPIIGDPIYGTQYAISDSYLSETLSLEDRAIHTGAKRLLLHANSLKFSFKGCNYTLYSRMDFRSQIEAITPKEKRHFNRLFS